MAKRRRQYVVIDPKICHGQPTFRGTRILVANVLDQVAMGLDWDAIIDSWRGKIDKPAIAEAIRLASTALVSQARRRVAS